MEEKNEDKCPTIPGHNAVGKVEDRSRTFCIALTPLQADEEQVMPQSSEVAAWPYSLLHPLRPPEGFLLALPLLASFPSAFTATLIPTSMMPREPVPRPAGLNRPLCFFPLDWLHPIFIVPSIMGFSAPVGWGHPWSALHT